MRILYEWFYMKEGFERTWRLTKKVYSVPVKVKAPIYDAMLRILESGGHLNLSKYVGDLIEKDIEERGIELEPVEAFGGEGRGFVIRGSKIVETEIICSRVTIPMIEMINGLLDSGLYRGASDYLRDVVKKDLESRGIEPGLIKAGADEEPSKKWRPSETATVSTQVPMSMMEDIDRLLVSGFYFRVSDYLIDLIRKDLEARASA